MRVDYGKDRFSVLRAGAQRAGMGKEFYEHFTSVRALFDAAEELRPGTLQQMFAGSDDELRQTENTQPCLYLADLAAACALRDSGLQPEAVAGSRSARSLRWPLPGPMTA